MGFLRRHGALFVVATTFAQVHGPKVNGGGAGCSEVVVCKIARERMGIIKLDLFRLWDSASYEHSQ